MATQEVESCVLIGFVNSEDQVKDEKKEQICWKTNRVGGCPAFSPMSVPSELQALQDQDMVCPTCCRRFAFVCQLYCPVDESDLDRVLYVFACVSGKCGSKQWKVVRSMTLPIEVKARYQIEDHVDVSVEEAGDPWLESENNWNDEESIETVPVKGPPCPLKAAIEVSPLFLEDENVNLFTPMYITVEEEEDVKKWAQNETLTHLKKDYEESVSSEANGEKYEKSPLLRSFGKDQATYKFFKSLSVCPQQVIRYNWDGMALFNKSGIKVSPAECPSCGSPRTFEMQLMPGLINFLTPRRAQSEKYTLDFGSVLVFSCRNNCSQSQFLTEECYFLEDPDNAVLSEHLSKQLQH